MSIKVYLTRANKWRWKRMHSNGKTNYDSVRSFSTQDDAQQAVDAARQQMAAEWDGSEAMVSLDSLAERANKELLNPPDTVVIGRELQALTKGKGWNFVDGELMATSTFATLVYSLYSEQFIRRIQDDNLMERDMKIVSLEEKRDLDAGLISRQADEIVELDGRLQEQLREVARLEQWGSRSFIKRLLRR